MLRQQWSRSVDCYFQIFRDFLNTRYFKGVQVNPRTSKRHFDDNTILPERVGSPFASRGIFFEIADGAASVTLTTPIAECDLYPDWIADICQR